MQVPVLASRRRHRQASTGGAPTPPVTSITSPSRAFIVYEAAPRALVIKDQLGNNVATACTYTLDNPAAGTISGGTLTAGAFGNGATVTVTHTASGQQTTFKFNALGVQGTFLKSIDPSIYANDAAFRADVPNNLGNPTAPVGGTGAVGTGTPGATLFTDGTFQDLITLDNSYLIDGKQSFRNKYPVGGSSPGNLAISGWSGQDEQWVVRIWRMTPGFTTVGSGGGSSAAKMAASCNWTANDGRASWNYTNTSQMVTEATYSISSVVRGGFNESAIRNNPTPPEWNDGLDYVEVTRYKILGDGQMSYTLWLAPIGTNLAIIGRARAGAMQNGYTAPQAGKVNAFGLNMNQTNLADKFINFGRTEVRGGVNPFKLIPPAPTPQAKTIVSHKAGMSPLTVTATAAGTTLLAYLSFTGSTTQVASLTDNKGNVWSRVPAARVEMSNGNYAAGEVWICPSGIAGVTTLTAALVGGGSVAIAFLEISGVYTALPVDAVAAYYESGNVQTAIDGATCVMEANAALFVAFATFKSVPLRVNAGDPNFIQDDVTSSGNIGSAHCYKASNTAISPLWDQTTSTESGHITIALR